jgi:hypothetical protein
MPGLSGQHPTLGCFPADGAAGDQPAGDQEEAARVIIEPSVSRKCAEGISALRTQYQLASADLSGCDDEEQNL